MITLVVVTDGRYDYLKACLASLEMVTGPFSRRLIVDDSGGPEWEPPDEWELAHHATRQGLAATVRHAWSLCDTDYLFHVEEDFVFHRPLDLHPLITTLDSHHDLAQLCFLRQPWSPEEQRAGGIRELDPAAYTLHMNPSLSWWQHRKCFSLNPCLVPRRVHRLGWPDGNEAEQTERLAESGYWFGLVDTQGPAVTHIGVRRSHSWKL